MANIQVRYATIPCLEIISEASRRLPEDMKDRHPEVKWAAIAGAGNVYRHDHEHLEAAQLGKTVHEALDPLQAAAIEELGPEKQ